MKKILFAALIAVATATSAFSADINPVNAAMSENFKTSFKGASNVSWSTKADYVKASFILNNERMEAFYNLDGEWISTCKYITVEQLPVNAQQAFKTKYEGYAVKEAIYFEGEEESAYFISIENEGESTIVKVSNDGGLSTFKTKRK